MAPKRQHARVDPAAFMDDPDWASFLPEVDLSGPKCRLPAHEDCTPLDVDAVAAHLEPGGTLGGMPGYESRPGQLDMVRAVARAFNSREHLMVEAGTGVGKSLAYLVPAVQWSFLNDTPVVLSTATRNLQSQLVSSDLPRAAQTLGDDAPKFRATLLKGRSNYLCLRMLGEYMQGGYWTLAEDERESFARLVDWLHETADGDLDDFGDEQLRPRLACPPEDCMGRACPFRQKCFIVRARARALKSHVVVVNHSLVLTEASSPGAGILPAHGRLVFDEAHNLEDIATDFFSYELSRPALARLLGKVARPSKSRRGPGRMRGALGTVERQLQKGVLASSSAAGQVRELLVRAHVQLKFAQNAGEALFDVVKRLFSPKPEAGLIRYRKVSETVRQYCLQGLFADYNSSQWDESALRQVQLEFENALAKLQILLTDLAKLLRAVGVDEVVPLFDDLAAQLETIAASFTAFILESKFVLSASDPSRVYWVEKCKGNRRLHQPDYERLVAAPLSVAAEMKRYFYDALDSVVLCSATLRAGDRFDYMARKLGVALLEPQRVKSLVAASPFDYFTQTLVMAPNSLPEPGNGDSENGYAALLAPFLRDLFVKLRGRGLVLFTAYEMMRAVAELVRPQLAEGGIQLFAQGEGVSREGMVAALKTATPERPVVLFGAQSFWEGVDVPGAALSCVVVARLPFPQVGEPIVEARCERIKEEGGTPFRDYMLPEAQIRFRQGFGRLVRTRADRGVVVVTDPRIVSKSYGALFRKVIPATVHATASLQETIDRAAAFFEAE